MEKEEIIAKICQLYTVFILTGYSAILILIRNVDTNNYNLIIIVISIFFGSAIKDSLEYIIKVVNNYSENKSTEIKMCENQEKALITLFQLLVTFFLLHKLLNLYNIDNLFLKIGLLLLSLVAALFSILPIIYPSKNDN